MECLEEENKLEIGRDLLQGEAYGGDREEPGDVEEEGENNDRKDMVKGEQLRGFIHYPLLKRYKFSTFVIFLRLHFP